MRPDKMRTRFATVMLHNPSRTHSPKDKKTASAADFLSADATPLFFRSRCNPGPGQNLPKNQSGTVNGKLLPVGLVFTRIVAIGLSDQTLQILAATSAFRYRTAVAFWSEPEPATNRVIGRIGGTPAVDSRETVIRGVCGKPSDAISGGLTHWLAGSAIPILFKSHLVPLILAETYRNDRIELPFRRCRSGTL